MSKGGGGTSIDTSGIRAAAAQEQELAQQAARLATANWTQGQGMYTGYEQPVLDMYKNIIMNPGQTTDPNFNTMMQLPLQQGQQAAGAATKNLLNMGLGPIATQTGKQQIDLSRMANAQTGALQNLQTMFTALIGAGQQGTSLQAGAPSQITGAASAVGQSGSLMAQIAQMQMQAAQSNNQGLMQGMQGIGSIVGMLGGAILGGPVGAGIGSALGGLAGNAAGSIGGFDYKSSGTTPAGYPEFYGY